MYWWEVSKFLLLVVGCFTISALFTPLLQYLLDRCINWINIKSPIRRRTIVPMMQCTKYDTAYKIGSIYIPKPIKNIMDRLYFGKYFVKPTVNIGEFQKRIPKPLPYNNIYIIGCPFLKLVDNNSIKSFQFKRIIKSIATKCKQYLLMAILIILLLPVIVLASDITGANYRTIILVSNNGTAASDVFVIFTANTTDMINGGVVSETVTDAAMRDSVGNDVAFMPGWDTNPWLTYVENIEANSQKYQYLYTGNVTGGKLCYFPGAAGMTIDNDVSMRLYDEFRFVIEDCYIDTTAKALKRVIYKAGACQLIVSATVNGTITFSITGGASVSATAIPTGEHDIEVSANTTDLMIYIDGLLKNSTAFTDDVPYNGYDWVFFEGDTVKYVKSLKLYK